MRKTPQNIISSSFSVYRLTFHVLNNDFEIHLFRVSFLLVHKFIHCAFQDLYYSLQQLWLHKNKDIANQFKKDTNRKEGKEYPY